MTTTSLWDDDAYRDKAIKAAHAVFRDLMVNQCIMVNPKMTCEDFGRRMAGWEPDEEFIRRVAERMEEDEG